MSVAKIEHALTALVARHEALRTAFVDLADEVWQETAPPGPVKTRYVTAGTYDDALEIARVERTVPFDLAKAPLLRSCVIDFGDDESLLVLTAHQAVLDSWSMRIVWREFRALYEGRVLAEPAYTYGDHLDRQNAWLAGDEADDEREFWRRRLGDELPPLTLGRARSAVPQGEATAERLSAEQTTAERLGIDADVRRAVAEVARRHDATEPAVLLAAFVATCHRYTRQDHIVVGLPVDGRIEGETQGIVGRLANVLVLKTSVSPELRFSGLVEDVSAFLAAALERQRLPFDEVLRDLAPAAPASAGEDKDDWDGWDGAEAAVQATFAFSAAPEAPGRSLDGLWVEPVPVPADRENVDFGFSVRCGAAGAFASELICSTALMDRHGARSWLESFNTLLADATRRPWARLDELLMLPPPKSAEMAEKANDEFDVYPELGLIHAAFESVALRDPDLVAIEIGATSIRYGELDLRANLLARRLVDAGAGVEHTIGICVERSIDLVVALLAVLKSGAAFVPLDPRLPVGRMSMIAESAGATAIITQEPLLAALSGLNAPLIVVPREDTATAAEPPAITASPGNTAYVYYTSGSTGTAKGVVIDHRCAAGRLEWLLRRYPLRPGERVVHKTPLIFDVAIWEIFGPLSTGATIVMVDPGAESDVAQIGRLLAKEGTVFAHFVPSMLNAYLNYAPRRAYPDLRWVQLSGEAVPARLLERFTKHFSAEFHNMYGQTETSEVAAWEGRTHRGSRTVPIGRQIGIYRLFVVDEALNLVPPGVPGELCVAGDGGLARGYQRDPRLTAARFVPNPFAVRPGERLYRTGDLAVVDEAGVIGYLGRIDAQTKIRGCRVEPGEVEEALASHPGVRDCAVSVRRDERDENELVAYLVMDDLSVEEVAEHARLRLPGYMLPEVYVCLDALPLTPSGKLDRLRLPAPTTSDRQRGAGAGIGADGAADADPPETHVEKGLAALFKDVLGMERVGRHDDFFTIGGNSLKSLQILNRIKSTFGVEVSVRDFFGGSTIAALASNIERLVRELVAAMPEAEAAKSLDELER